MLRNGKPFERAGRKARLTERVAWLPQEKYRK